MRERTLWLLCTSLALPLLAASGCGNHPDRAECEAFADHYIELAVAQYEDPADVTLARETAEGARGQFVNHCVESGSKETLQCANAATTLETYRECFPKPPEKEDAKGDAKADAKVKAKSKPKRTRPTPTPKPKPTPKPPVAGPVKTPEKPPAPSPAPSVTEPAKAAPASPPPTKAAPASPPPTKAAPASPPPTKTGEAASADATPPATPPS